MAMFISCFIDLLHGAHIVDERVFNVQGDKEQYFNWNECGFRLYIPEGALLSTETCPVAVKAIIAGRFILPKRTELVSAFYAISASRKFQRKVKTELQHGLLLENEAQTKHLHFIKAHQTNPGLPYHFELQPGGEFIVNTHYAALWQSEFSIEAIVTKHSLIPMMNQAKQRIRLQMKSLAKRGVMRVMIYLMMNLLVL